MLAKSRLARFYADTMKKIPWGNESTLIFLNTVLIFLHLLAQEFLKEFFLIPCMQVLWALLRLFLLDPVDFHLIRVLWQFICRNSWSVNEREGFLCMSYMQQWTGSLKLCKEVLMEICIPNSTLAISWGDRKLWPHLPGGSLRCSSRLYKQWWVCGILPFFNCTHLWPSDCLTECTAGSSEHSPGL